MSNLVPLAVHIVFSKDNKVFLLKRSNTGFMDNYWSLPAGRIEKSESGIEAAIREAEEEVGVIILPSQLSTPLVMHHHDNRGDRIYLFFVCKEWKGELKNMEEDKCSEVKWYEIESLPEKMVDHVAKAIKLLNDKISYSEFGFSK